MVTSGSLRVVSHNGQILESVNNLFALPSIQRWRVTYQSIQKIWLQFVTTAWFVKKFLHWSELQRKGVSILALTALTSLFWSLGCRRRFLIPEIGGFTLTLPQPTTKTCTNQFFGLAHSHLIPVCLHRSKEKSRSASPNVDVAITQYSIISSSSLLLRFNIFLPLRRSTKCRRYTTISIKSNSTSHSNRQNGTENTKSPYYV